MRKPNRNDSKYYRTINRYGELGSVSKFREDSFKEDMKKWRISLSTADHAQLTENLVDSQSDSATNSKEKRR